MTKPHPDSGCRENQTDLHSRTHAVELPISRKTNRDRMRAREFRPAILPRHRTCGFPRPALEPGSAQLSATALLQGMMTRASPLTKPSRISARRRLTQRKTSRAIPPQKKSGHTPEAGLSPRSRRKSFPSITGSLGRPSARCGVPSAAPSWHPTFAFAPCSGWSLLDS